MLTVHCVLHPLYSHPVNTFGPQKKWLNGVCDVDVKQVPQDWVFQSTTLPPVLTRCTIMLIVLRKTVTICVLLSEDFVISTCLNILGRNVIFYLEMQFILHSIHSPSWLYEIKKCGQYLQCLKIQNIC
jgi:hypothetical protein